MQLRCIDMDQLVETLDGGWVSFLKQDDDAKEPTRDIRVSRPDVLVSNKKLIARFYRAP